LNRHGSDQSSFSGTLEIKSTSVTDTKANSQ